MHMFDCVVVDFETRSRLALDRTNSYKYSRHPSTKVLCCSLTFPDLSWMLWTPNDGPFPLSHFSSSTVVLAYDAEFELNIWNNVCIPKYGWPPLVPRQAVCLQARANNAGFPRRLGLVSKTLALGAAGKDSDGHAVMLKMCKPFRAKLVGCEFFGGKFIDTPELHKANEDYCIQDGVAEYHVERLTLPLRPLERKLWLAHQRINERGVPVDVDFCRHATLLVKWEQERFTTEIKELTKSEKFPKGQVKSADCVVAMKKWLLAQDYKLPDLRTETLGEALEGNHGPMSDDVKRVLEIRRLAKDKAVTKFQGILNHAEADGRCRGAAIFMKAGTGRFQSSGVNFMNMRRLEKDEIPANLEFADRLSHPDGGDTLESIYAELRATERGVIPSLGPMVRLGMCAGPGKKLGVCDYSSVEMRILHWLAGDAKTLKQIREFDQGRGIEPYVIAAMEMFSKEANDITDDERQRGKVKILGCGYMSGAEKFQAFCKQYGIIIPLEEAKEQVQSYRRGFPLVVRFWYAVGRAAVRAVKTGKPAQIGIVKFHKVGPTLCITLPSGRELRYYDARIVQGAYGDAIEAIDVRSGKRRAVGLPTLIENIDQGIGFDLLEDALIRCDAEDIPVVLHVYDEIVIEIDEHDDKTLKRVQEIMTTPPEWARGLPIDAKTGEGRRYVK